jgi:hypothetical protein
MNSREAIEGVLAKYGSVVPVDPDEYFDAKDELRHIRWRPLYLYDVDGTAWGISIFRGDFEPEFSATQMGIAREAYPVLRPAFFVPEGEDYAMILQLCVNNGIAIITKIGANYDFLPLAELPKPVEKIVSPKWRLPIQLVERTTDLQNIHTGFAEALARFGSGYIQLAEQGQLGEGKEGREQELLRRAFEELLAADPRFTASYAPLEVLRFFEKESQQTVKRDHFFHAFHDFLLGCIVLDQTRAIFEEFATKVIGNEQLSIEYIWLLASLFHDVGYTVELAPDFERLQFGPVARPPYSEGAEIGERIRAQRQGYWKGYTVIRLQLASLWDYLALDERNPPWLPEPVPFNGLQEHDFDSALYEGFMDRRCHGVASCLRLLDELHGLLRQERNSDRRHFLLSHIYLAGLSIPFHHDAFRQALRSVGIGKLSTYRFPFASLLMFIDSIQDDRREMDLGAAGPDMLRDVLVEGTAVTAIIDWDDLTEAQVAQIARKRKEALDVLEFLEPDGLEYRYPPKFLGQLA